MKKQKENKYDMVIIGGLGHVGLPLGLSFASAGKRVCLYDLDLKKAALLKKGVMPFIEYGAEKIIKKVLAEKLLDVSSDMSIIAQAEHVIIATATPVDEYLNPQAIQFLDQMTDLKKHLDTHQTIIIRSTVFPGTCRQVIRYLGIKKTPWQVAYCPERIAQGYSIRELRHLPQIVAGLTAKAEKKAALLFSALSPKIIRTSVEEAEFAKLFTNAWRYLQFAATNEFFMICRQSKLDYNRIRNVMVDSYGRLGYLPAPGFAAGPCLLKDTLQLAAASHPRFSLGHSAMMINEGLPSFIVEDLKSRHDLASKKVGVLGMAFKADIDDIRDSLSYKLVKALRFAGAQVLCSDEFVKNPAFVSKETLMSSCDIIIIGVPHSLYKGLIIPPSAEIIDLWGVTHAARQIKPCAK
ncbi:MAG: nucleotide sugar dehydrogenase [Candidatus Omnitrophica bacterium]|nr:nucleotide sugar dehydrogenase [Candidatus Omnitrophota bacterium]